LKQRAEEKQQLPASINDIVKARHNVEVIGAQGQVRPKGAYALVRPCRTTC
jgi:hypothetical protein